VPQSRKTQDLLRQQSVKQPTVRKVNGFLIYIDDYLGEGQYGKVCKAQKIADQEKSQPSSQKEKTTYRPTPDPSKKIYACKIIDVSNISKDDMDCI
jgi:serine/threonine protein kinase